MNFTINDEEVPYIVGRNHSWEYDRLDLLNDIQVWNLCAAQSVAEERNASDFIRPFNETTKQLGELYPCDINHGLVRRQRAGLVLIGYGSHAGCSDGFGRGGGAGVKRARWGVSVGGLHAV